ncbi:DUF885 domain-containing protein [Sphingomonas morindae]|uniref:DUF885 domain-containing protein n=1 Tax=Sphingomonas morindae TaxID=1541170 RepID=A0ABY4XBZ2_9SPHN|nr:DUF885 domain-containing protein [Sphingomonas morindae]USI74492.1 DUF885 domain-containing protein [Sphingomonas morindae]
MGARPAPRWEAFRDAYIATDFRLDPAFAVQAGRHEQDGRLPDWSEAGLARRAEFLRGSIRRAEAFPAAALTADQRFERDYLVAVAKGRLFWLTDADQPHHNPAWYFSNGIDPGTYTSRPYAAPAVRMKAMIAYLRAVPGAVAQIRANLRMPMPASFIHYGVTAFGGLADYYPGDGKKAFASVRDPALQAAYDAAAAPAAAAMRQLAAWLQANAAHATQDYALGPARFARMLAATEMVDTPLDRLEAIGRADLARNKAALAEACARYLPGGTVRACIDKAARDKPAEGPVAAARRQVPGLRAFVVQHDLLTIPGREQALVAAAPPYNAQNSAYIDPPGPFDIGVPSIYYIAPPDPRWSKAQQDAYIPSRGDLLFTTVHEVMPGHFVQFLHANRAASPIGRLYVGYAYAEGWAHYAEEMMWQAGLGDGDPETHIGQLTNALLRNVRFLSAIGLHTRGMSEAESRRMFIDDGYQDPGNAEQQAARGTYDPAYLNYTLGKLMILKLRADWTRSHGGRAGWKAFHDQFLSYGGPPIPLVRARMLPGGGAAL